MSKIMIMAGGTGGHVFPGLAVAQVLREQGHEIAWLGTANGIEARLVPAANIPLHFLSVVGLRGKGLAHLIKAPFKIIAALMQALSILRKEKPACVLGMGGFVAGPGALAAKFLGIPLVIHEQNAIAGTTNRLLSGLANRVLQAFAGTFEPSKKAQTVGNPVRKQLPIKQAESHDKLQVLVVGGSLGAQAINQVLPEVAKAMADVAIWHQTGKDQEQSVQAAYGDFADVRVSAFIDDMAAAYAWADVVICRAGAMTVSEIAAVGLPAIFVPYPYAIDDHQTANANILAKQNAAIVLPQAEMSSDKLVGYLRDFQQNPEKTRQMAANAAQLGVRDAAETVANVCLELIHD